MSDYCGNCAYRPQVKLGADAYPYNYLYWNFLMANHEQLESNPRMTMPYRTLARMPAERRRQIARESSATPPPHTARGDGSESPAVVSPRAYTAITLSSTPGAAATALAPTAG